MQTEMDLQEKTRMLDTYTKLNSIIDDIGELDISGPLVWVWIWDVTTSIYKDVMEGGDPEYCVTMDESEVFELFWRDANKNEFSLEYGSERLYEDIRAWMFETGIIEIYDGDDL